MIKKGPFSPGEGRILGDHEVPGCAYSGSGHRGCAKRAPVTPVPL